jgi:hypothetical protein
MVDELPRGARYSHRSCSRTSLPRNDVQTVTHSGDIVLYSGDQIVVFYGSNSWAYTRLGRITSASAEDMTDLLAKRDVVVTLSLK